MSKTVRTIAILIVLTLMAGCSSRKSSTGLSDRPEVSGRPPVFLNYVYLTLDSETYRTISESEFIRREFCLFGQSTPMNPGGEIASATYLLGEGTCIELLAPGDSKGSSEGNSGICFSTGRSGDIDVVYDNLRAELGPNVQRGSTTFDTGDGRVPWLRYVTSQQAPGTPPLLTWLTEHDPGFHKVIGPNSDCRLTALPAGAAHGEAAGGQKLFRDITGVTLSVTRPELERLAAELSAYGYTRKRSRGVNVFSGPGIEICAVVSKAPGYRIRSIRCSLSRIPAAPGEMTFGTKATLTLTTEATAIWSFGPRHERFARR